MLAAGASAALPKLAGRDVLTGKLISIDQYRGRPVFVNFWGSSCYACQREARTLATFARTHERQVAFLGVDVIDSRTAAKVFYARYDTDYPSISDPRARLAGAWTRGTPTTLVFNGRHRLVRRIEGAVTTRQLAAALKLVSRS